MTGTYFNGYGTFVKKRKTNYWRQRNLVDLEYRLLGSVQITVCKLIFTLMITTVRVRIFRAYFEIVSWQTRSPSSSCRHQFVQCLCAFEAIRPDRMRGGRSNYEGCYPSSVPHDVLQPTVAVTSVMSGSPSQLAPRRTSSSSSMRSSGSSSVNRSGSGSNLLIGGVSSTSTPPLADLLIAETLMAEEETLPRCCESRLTDDDPDPFGSLLHLTDHCLYRIVRWARNRPDFANISVNLKMIQWKRC